MIKIAIIDDDLDIILAMEAVLQSKNYTTITAQNMNAGLRIIREENPDLIILDVMMEEPDDGFFLAKIVRKEGIKTPIIMCSSISHALGMKYGKSEMIPVNLFLDKPVSPELLLEKVELLLKK